MHRLYLQFFGRFQATLDDTPVKITAPKQQALLAWLALHPDTAHSRDTLVGLLWPEHDETRGRQNMRHMLSKLRKLLPDYLDATRSTVGWAAGCQWASDASQFSERLEAGALAEACALYSGDFLDGVLVDSAEFQEWSLLKREYLRREYTNTLASLTETAFHQRDYDSAYKHAWQRTVADQFDEAAHRDVIRALALDDRKSAALAHFERLNQLLADELGVEPSSESSELVATVRAGTLTSPTQITHAAKSSNRHNLPVQQTDFVGREDLLDKLTHQLAQPNCRLVTLLGMGGVGKTRLSIELGSRLLPNFSDGVWFVPLAALNETDGPGVIINAIAAALGVDFPNSVRDGAARLKFLIGRIKMWDCLLILDNFEHLLDHVEPVATLIDGLANAKFVVTSREPLVVRAEWLTDVDGLDGNAARTLFVTSARRVSAEFIPSPAIDTIVQQVAGLPLAIELAAGWVRLFSCEEIAQQITQDITFLRSQRRDMPQRHRSMRAVFNYSWRLLDDEQRALLKKLAIFPADFSTHAVKAVCQADLWLLDSLTAQSLVQIMPNGRFQFHPAVRQFSAEKRATAHDELTTRFRTHYLNQLAALDTIPAEEMLPKVETDLTNIVSAWRLSAEAADNTLLLAATPPLFNYFNRKGKRLDALTLLQQTMQLLGTRGNTKLNGELYGELTAVCFSLAMFKEGLQYGIASTEAATACNDFETLARTAYNQGELCWNGGQLDEGEAHFIRALALSKAHNMPRVEALASIGLSNHYRFKGAMEDALAASQRAVTLSRIVGDLRVQRTAYASLGMAHEDLGNKQEALFCQEQSLATAQSLDDLHSIAICHNNLAGLLSKAGRYAEAEAHCVEGIALCRKVDSRFIESILHFELASSYSAQYRFDEAAPSFKIAVERALIANHMGRAALSEWTYGIMALRRGAWHEASQLLHAAVERLASLGPSLSLAETLCVKALAAWRLGKRDEAEALVERALATSDLPQAVALGRLVIGRIRLSQGEFDAAIDAFAESDRLFAAIGGMQHSADEAAVGQLSALQQLGQTDDVLQQRLEARLRSGEVYGLLDPIEMFVVCLRGVFSAELHQQALTLLNQTAAAISNPLQRHAYLHNIPSHIALFALDKAA